MEVWRVNLAGPSLKRGPAPEGSSRLGGQDPAEYNVNNMAT
jgi:hypothetical protein